MRAGRNCKRRRIERMNGRSSSIESLGRESVCNSQISTYYGGDVLFRRRSRRITRCCAFKYRRCEPISRTVNRCSTTSSNCRKDCKYVSKLRRMERQKRCSAFFGVRVRVRTCLSFIEVQLEEIRNSGTELRWRPEEDFQDCQRCHASFSVTWRKHHCRKYRPSSSSSRRSRILPFSFRILADR